jgi:para-nitrobenzyl esterase
MRRVLMLLPLLAIAACAPRGTGGPVLPGTINAPPPPIAAPGDALLTGIAWSWQGTQASDGARTVPESPERYSVEFQPGGRANIRADCNRGSASYLLDGGALSFGPIALTRAMCPPGSREADFLAGLRNVSGQRFDGSALVLTLKGETGAMRFSAPRQ